MWADFHILPALCDVQICAKANSELSSMHTNICPSLVRPRYQDWNKTQDMPLQVHENSVMQWVGGLVTIKTELRLILANEHHCTPHQN